MAQYEIEVILLRQLASYLAMPIFIVDPRGALVFYNEPAEIILGKRFEETGEMSPEEWSKAFQPTDEQGRPLEPGGVPLMIAFNDRRPTHGSLWIQALDGDGLTLRGQAVQILHYDAGWEAPLIEAPSLVAAGGTYYLFYSANWWNTARYAIGYATATSVLGPYTKKTTTGPWFASDRAVAGPGGQEWFRDNSGVWRMAYHGWQPAAVGYPHGARSLRLATVAFDGGAPVAS